MKKTILTAMVALSALFAKCAIGAGDISSAPTETAPCFEWIPGENPSGWISSWGNTSHPEWGNGTEGAPCFFITENGIVTNAVTRHDGNGANQKWQPWNETAPAMNQYTFCTYGNVDLVTASEGKFAILWSMGRQAKHALVKDEEGNIKFLQLGGVVTGIDVKNPIVEQEINAGPISGWHLFTVRFNSVSGASIQIDDGEIISNPDFLNPASNGLQIGTVLGEASGICEPSRGFALRKIIAFDTDELPESDYQILCDNYPPVESTFYETQDRIVVQRGTLVVLPGTAVIANAFEFGDSDKSVAPYGFAYGLKLFGEMYVLPSQKFSGNDVIDAYDACNNGEGMIFGEWKGNGVFDIVGEGAALIAEGTILVGCYTADKSTINVNGGYLGLKGITSKYSDRVEINLTNNGMINYGLYPSAPNGIRIAKNYGFGTVIATPYGYGDEEDGNAASPSDIEANTRIDKDAITLTDSEFGTTFAADYSRYIFEGPITGSGKLNIDCHIPDWEMGEEGAVGEIVLKNYNAGPIDVLGGILTITPDATITGGLSLYENATLNLQINDVSEISDGQIIFENVILEEGAQLLINGEETSGEMSLVFEDDALKISFADGNEEIEVINGSLTNLGEITEGELAEAISKCRIVLTSEDIDAGLTEDKLMIVAEPIKNASDETIGYNARVKINPAAVNIPEFTRWEVDEVNAISVEKSPATDAAVTIGIRNAVRGLWYGCETTDDLKQPFEKDVPSFSRATKDGIKTISPTPCTGNRRFYKIIALPCAP